MMQIKRTAREEEQVCERDHEFNMGASIQGVSETATDRCPWGR
jgi:hypothetical protein